MNDEPVGVLALRFLRTTANGFPCSLNQEQAEALLEMLNSIERGQIPLDEIFPHLFGKED